MSESPQVYLRVFEKPELKHAKIFSGISPKAMQKVFCVWSLFAIIVAIIVTGAPDLSQTFTLTVFAVLVVFTVAMFAQSRIAEGWPAIMEFENELCVVRDPQKREFICVPVTLIQDVEPTFIKPDKKAVALILDTDKLNDTDTSVLQEAVWPRDDRLLALAQFISREKACKNIKAFLK